MNQNIREKLAPSDKNKEKTGCFLKVLNWYSSVVVRYPLAVVGFVISVVVTCGVVVVVSDVPIPSFDSLLGFEARGTDLGKALVTSLKIPDDCGIIEAPYKETLEVTRAKENLKILLNMTFEGLENSQDGISSVLPRLSTRPNRKRRNVESRNRSKINKRSTAQKKCQEKLNPLNPKWIHSSSTSSANIWTLKKLRSICDADEAILDRFQSLRDAECPAPFSLPTVVMEMVGVSVCADLTRYHLVLVEGRLRRCGKFYRRDNDDDDDDDPTAVSSLLKSCCADGELGVCASLPPECYADRCAVFRLLYFHTDKSFDPASGETDLRYALTILPKTTDDASKPLTKKLALEEFLVGKLEEEETKILSMHENGLFNKVFDDKTFWEIFNYSVPATIVLVIMFVYTRSLLLSAATFLLMALTIVVASFIYYIVVGVAFFPFHNVLVMPLLIGIGADDVFVFNDIWNRLKRDEPGESYQGLITKTMQHAVVSIFVTSFTTGSSFLANYVSDIVTIKCFALFAGISLFVKFFLMTSLLPPLLLLYEKTLAYKWCYLQSGIYKNEQVMMPIGNTNEPVTQFFGERILTTVVIRGRFIFLPLLLCLSIGASYVVFVNPTMKLPSKNAFTLFYDNHPFEKFRKEYKFEFDGLSDEKFERVNLPVDVFVGIERRDDGDRLNPNDHGSCRLLDVDLTSDRSQTWMDAFCTQLMRRPFIHASAAREQRCAVAALREFAALPCDRQRNESLNSFVDEYDPRCCGVEEFPMPPPLFSSCFENFLRLFSPDEREYFVGIPYFTFQFGNAGLFVTHHDKSNDDDDGDDDNNADND